MPKRFFLSLAMLGVGAAFLAAASTAGPQTRNVKSGGILEFSLFAGIENIDPQKSYYSVEWQYEWLTARPLLNFPHARGAQAYRLVNDGARSYTVSPNGKRYTFHLRRGMRFSDGSRVKAANYKHALLRLLHPNLDVPYYLGWSLASLFTDPFGVEIVGALEYHRGQTTTVPGIGTAGPYTLVITLVSPSPALVSLLAIPPTGAVATTMPFEPITSVSSFNPLPSGGRYYVQEYVPDRRLRIRKNRFYRPLGAPPTPGRAAGFDYDLGVQQDQAYLLIKNGQLDWAADGLPPSAWSEIFRRYGTKGRARVFPTSIVDYITLNNSKGVFADVNARKAIAWGIDRSLIASFFGRYARTPQCSLLTPAVPGYRRCTEYPNTPDLARARSLASGHVHDRINYWYTSSTSGPQIQQLVTAQLRAIGFDNIEHRPFSSGVLAALGRRGNDYDIAVIGWEAPFPDPAAVLNSLLSGETIRDVLNTNTAYFNDPEANRLLRRAASLTGKKRLTAYGNLDLLIQERWTPLVVLGRRNDRAFFAVRIDTKSIVQSPVYGLDLGRLALR